MEKNRHLPFFVYGTLLTNQPNFYLWESDIIATLPAVFPGGRLYDMGYYPMMVTAAPSETVRGMLITVDPGQHEAVLQRLDELEGYDPEQPDETGYRRHVVEVVLGDGRSQQAWVYLGDIELVQNRPIVTGGNWVEYTANNQPDLTDFPHRQADDASPYFISSSAPIIKKREERR